MPGATDYPARGKVKEVRGDIAVFQPTGTSYELHLKMTGIPSTGPIDQPVEGIIRVQARKVWTVPSGGNFVQPIFGPPRIIQGRVKWLDETTLVVQAGTMFLIDLPASERAFDLASGPIEAGSLVNVTALPGATFELRTAAAVEV